MSPEEKIKKYHDLLSFEVKHCARIAYIHQNIKETCTAYKLKLKEAREELKNAKK